MASDTKDPYDLEDDDAELDPEDDHKGLPESVDAGYYWTCPRCDCVNTTDEDPRGTRQECSDCEDSAWVPS